MPSHTDFTKWAATSWSHFRKIWNGAVLVWVFMSCGGSDEGDFDYQTDYVANFEEQVQYYAIVRFNPLYVYGTVGRWTVEA
jgi:hypothetical protein